MMILRTTDASPFGRKVRIAADILGLSDAIKIEAADTNDPEDTLRTQNPLGKLPVLMTAEGTAVYDSRVIIEYLEGLASGSLLPETGDARIAVLTQQALADGIMDAAVLQVYEKRFRPEALWHGPYLEYQAGKVERGLTSLQQNLPSVAGTPHIGAIAIAAALGYLDLRFEGAWRTEFPALVAWLDGFSAAVPSFAATKPS